MDIFKSTVEGLVVAGVGIVDLVIREQRRRQVLLFHVRQPPLPGLHGLPRRTSLPPFRVPLQAQRPSLATAPPTRTTPVPLSPKDGVGADAAPIPPRTPSYRPPRRSLTLRPPRHRPSASIVRPLLPLLVVFLMGAPSSARGNAQKKVFSTQSENLQQQTCGHDRLLTFWSRGLGGPEENKGKRKAN